MVLVPFDIVLLVLATLKMISLHPFQFVFDWFLAFDFGGKIRVDVKNVDFEYFGGIGGQVCAHVEFLIQIMKTKYYVFVGFSFSKMHEVKCMLMSNC